MTPYHAQNADLFRSVAEILARDYKATEVTEETVAEWCEMFYDNAWTKIKGFRTITLMEPSELAALIADVERYERREV